MTPGRVVWRTEADRIVCLRRSLTALDSDQYDRENIKIRERTVLHSALNRDHFTKQIVLVTNRN